MPRANGTLLKARIETSRKQKGMTSLEPMPTAGNDKKTLADAFYRKRHNKPMPMNDVLAVVFAVMDHFNSLHFYDRNLMGEEIKMLRERIEALEKQP